MTAGNRGDSWQEEHRGLQLRRQRIYDGDTNAVKSAGYLVPAVPPTELPTSMKDGQNCFQRRLASGRVHVCGNSPAIV